MANYANKLNRFSDNLCRYHKFCFGAVNWESIFALMNQRFPYELRYVLNEHFAGVYVYPVLRNLLGQQVLEQLIGKFNQRYNKGNRIINWSVCFLEYGEEFINPVLNQRLNREPNYPTFIKLVEWS